LTGGYERKESIGTTRAPDFSGRFYLIVKTKLR
jgi:hypothetical protein